jgi:signal transduction histidine kinase
VDLLKRENIPGEKAQEYIRVLDEKSQRLKQLTLDLVEASKISSGNITLEMSDINVKELLSQAIGEYEDKLSEKKLSVVTSYPEEEVIIRADSRRMWRVTENLLVNICKYSMEGTRVYVDVTSVKDSSAPTETVELVFKNISAQPLNIPAEELTERFIRGDVSRSSEGSGLGLSIAQNLTVAQGGEFKIYLDGDLFKVVLRFPRK